MTKTKIDRRELVEMLLKRDGFVCQYPGCDEPLSRFATGRKELTIDHVFPQSKARAAGWSESEIWALDNLDLMHKACNAKKSDRVYNDDGTLPEPPMSRFKYRRAKRAQRPEICTDCNAGRNLGDGEFCNACGSGAQPARFPKWRQMGPKDCDHDLFFCVSCTVWFPETRRSTLDTLLTGGDGYE